MMAGTMASFIATRCVGNWSSHIPQVINTENIPSPDMKFRFFSLEYSRIPYPSGKASATISHHVVPRYVSPESLVRMSIGITMFIISESR